MKVFVIILLLALSQPILAEKIKFEGGHINANKKMGFYAGHYKRQTIKYYVDVKTKLCFAYIEKKSNSNGGAGLGNALTAIPCHHLKHRPEWATIISWIH